MLSSLSICAGRSGREHERQGNESGREWMVTRLERTSWRASGDAQGAVSDENRVKDRERGRTFVNPLDRELFESTDPVERRYCSLKVNERGESVSGCERAADVEERTNDPSERRS